MTDISTSITSVFTQSNTYFVSTTGTMSESQTAATGASIEGYYSKDGNAGKIAGGVIGGIVGLGLLVALVYAVCKVCACSKVYPLCSGR